MTTSIKTTSLIAVSMLLGACTYNISPYGVSAENVEAMRAKLTNAKPLGVERFTSAASKSEITCRAAGPVKTPNAKPFETYIEEALISELKLTGFYKATAPSKLKANITRVDFNSNIGAGKWFIDASITLNGESFAVTSETPFDASFVADKACQETAQTFSLAVQNFIKAVVTHPKFAKLVQ